MASLARFHLRLLQSWLPVRSSVWAFIVSLLQRCLHTGVVKGYTVSVSHFPPFKRVVFAHASAQANRRRMDPQVIHSSCKCIGTQTIHFACNDVILPKEKWHFASWQRLHWPYSLCEGVFFTLIGSAWNNLQSTAVTRCKQPPTRLF